MWRTIREGNETMNKKWTIDKNATHKAVLINTEKRILSYDTNLFWVRISGVEGSELYIYTLEGKPK
jgi:hypothetical protein